MDGKTVLVLLLALASLVVAGVFAPQAGIGQRQESVRIGEEVAGWLWRMAALADADSVTSQVPRSEAAQAPLIVAPVL